MNTRKLLAILSATATSFLIAVPAFARPAVLAGDDPGSRINVRSAPSLGSSTPHYGLIGDRVETLRSVQGEDGFTWYYVQFSSGAEGWVRGDFVRLVASSTTTGILRGGEPGSRVNVRSTPSIQASSPHYGLDGDRVRIVRSERGDDGYRWYFVRFQSGAEGWVRGDLIEVLD